MSSLAVQRYTGQQISCLTGDRVHFLSKIAITLVFVCLMHTANFQPRSPLTVPGLHMRWLRANIVGAAAIVVVISFAKGSTMR